MIGIVGIAVAQETIGDISVHFCVSDFTAWDENKQLAKKMTLRSKSISMAKKGRVVLISQQ